jgi:hypothetical protein
MRIRLGGIGLETPRSAVSERQIEGLDQGQEPHAPGNVSGDVNAAGRPVSIHRQQIKHDNGSKAEDHGKNPDRP